MLKALELSGFKSFADKTRFEFPDGITVIVGPNGSGKSNVVDAMKWVLGAQSAKSLRGEEMADVIFKGGGGGRRPSSTAEATIVFDNDDHQLSVDTPEVHVSRRVFRSGEGEYLVNGQPCRLKDIKDLFRGTGAGAQAYSLIEQGKVDALLAASPRDRRIIFEEAAGISRFKAKKVEATRRLERVEQNLLRLSDIVDEVDGRLKSLRSQAVKARRYREFNDRLQQLRTNVGFADWRQLSAELQQLQAELEQLREQTSSVTGETDAAEKSLRNIEREVESRDRAIRICEARIPRNREYIAGCESTIDHELRRMYELEDEATLQRSKLVAMNTRAFDLESDLRQTTAAVAEVESVCTALRVDLQEHEELHRHAESELAELKTSSEERRQEQTDLLRASADLGTVISGAESDLAAATKTEIKCRQQLADLEPSIQGQQDALTQLLQAEKELIQKASVHSSALKTVQGELGNRRRQHAEVQLALGELQRRHTAAHERATVLEELERRSEGLSSGVKEVLARAKQEHDGPYATVRGLVADLLQVTVETAPMIEAALAEKAQYVVVEGEVILSHLHEHGVRFSGRVGFIRLDNPVEGIVDRRDLSAQPGVIGRADLYVETRDENNYLVERLLGRTWFVEDLSAAISLSRSAARGLQLVTKSGEVVGPDGTLVVGPRHGASGIISRRSQLRDLRHQLKELETEIRDYNRSVSDLENEMSRLSEQATQHSEQHRRATTAVADHTARALAVKERIRQFKAQQSAAETELGTADGQRGRAQEELERARAGLQDVESNLAAVQQRLENNRLREGQLEQSRQTHAGHVTFAQVELARREQRLETLLAKMTQFQSDHQERQSAIDDITGQLQASQSRHQQSLQTVLANTSRLATQYLDKDTLAAETAVHVESREQLNRDRNEHSEKIHELRARLGQLADRQHKAELEAGQTRHQRETLVERLRDDYGIEISAVEDASSDEEQRQREEVESEISDLRRKINNIGAVNMDALEELDQLEFRHSSLAGQFADLTAAKQSLERIIQKINGDSRRVFAETLECIRGNFKVLFRKVFGGGQADIMLEDGEDILESGIEIVATPPGKHSLGLSLLSGGERALTAVTLLLAIFQYRPSPFCVLDEVDGPLDEANIERFIGVLHEFLDWTKFVIVTHSKKTMTAATTLYGITMQESGVSKRVSVRFDDVNDDGSISRQVVGYPETGEAAA